jgi:hypothetical protein
VLLLKVSTMWYVLRRYRYAQMNPVSKDPLVRLLRFFSATAFSIAAGAVGSLGIHPPVVVF